MDFIRERNIPEALCCITFCDPETGKRLVFLTNNFSLSQQRPLQPFTKSAGCRTFFQMDQTEYVNQHFYGTSENAVKTQIWIAVCVYTLAAIIKKDLMLTDLPLHISTDFVGSLVRENRAFMGFPGCR